jgi:hypothetical protein
MSSSPCEILQGLGGETSVEGLVATVQLREKGEKSNF